MDVNPIKFTVEIVNTVNRILMQKAAKKVFADFIVGKNLKMSQQRELILDIFLKTETHFTPEELYNLVKRKDKSIGQATVYRMVKLLRESGVAERIYFGDNVSMYEHKYGHDHHDHLYCEKCKKKVEVIDPRIETLQEKLAEKYGFSLTDHKMVLIGLCRECRKKK